MFVLKDGMEQRDSGGVRGFVWSFCRALVVVVVVKQPVCFCVCVWPWQGAGGVLGLLLGTGGGGAQQRLFCGVLWCVGRGQRTEDRGGGKEAVCALCVCGAAAVCFFALPKGDVDGWMDGWMVMPCVSQQQQQQQERRRKKKNEETKHAFCVCVCVCVCD